MREWYVTVVNFKVEKNAFRRLGKSDGEEDEEGDGEVRSVVMRRRVYAWNW